MTLSTSSARHLLVRLTEPARLPEALLGALRDEVVIAGWVRASGVLADVELRAYDARLGGFGPTRRIAGPVHALIVEGSVGLSNGDVSCGLRAVLARDTDGGLETLAGEIVDARVIALETMITALDDIATSRSLDRSGVWLLDVDGTGAARPVAAAASPAPPPAAAPSPAPRPSPTFSSGAVMPPRPVKPQPDLESAHIYPDTGDLVEHFAFGRCEVVKSDGDRLHVRLSKDGRVKEIALDMLKVTPLPPEEGQVTKHYKLDRKL